jgi:effector-binding domain-containing protein
VTLEKPLGGSPMDRLGGITGAPVAPILDSAATQLKSDAATLKPEPFTGLSYEIVQLSPKPFLYIEGQVPQDPAAIEEAVAQSLLIVNPIMARNGLKAAGAPIAVETAWKDGQYAFQAGLPYEGTKPRILIGVKAGETPSGQAIKVVYQGSEDQILPTYDKMEALIAAGRLTQGESFEVYNDDPTQKGGSVNREIYYLVTGDTSQLAKIAPPAAPAPAAAPVASVAASAAPSPSTTP